MFDVDTIRVKDVKDVTVGFEMYWCNHRIINDRMEKTVKGRRFMNNLL